MLTTILFYVFSVILLIAAFRVVTVRNPVSAALHLILTFFTAAMVWMLLEAEFLALLLVVVYVGAVMVLFLFVVMMFDFTEEVLHKNFRAYMPLGLVVGGVMVAEIGFVIFNTYNRTLVSNVDMLSQANASSNMEAIGVLMYSQYSYPVILGSILLLVGMIAAVGLTLRRRTDVKRNDPVQQVRVRAKDRLRMVSMPAVKADMTDSDTGATS